MKIGIMTFWMSSDNYGQQLQCYALQKYLRNAGHDAYLIRYNIYNDYAPKSPRPVWKKFLKLFNPNKLYRYLSDKKQMTTIAQENKKNEKREFEGFRSKYIKQSERIYNRYDELKENPPEADVYIVGSDQVWNPNYYLSLEKQVGAYFLGFGDSSIKRISYAPSFCNEKLNDEIVKIIAPLLKKFDYVSVREKQGLNICKQCGINNAEYVPDPTILLDANTYRALYKNEVLRKTGKQYCFLYFLNNGSDFHVKNVYDWAKRKNIEVVYVSANFQVDKYKKTYATIPEWIYLLEHSEYVITNSYHCCVFALLFEKKFSVIPISQKHKEMNSRVDSLFELFQIEKRWVNSDFSILNNEINWRQIREKFQDLRDSSNLVDVIETATFNKRKNSLEI